MLRWTFQQSRWWTLLYIFCSESNWKFIVIYERQLFFCLFYFNLISGINDKKILSLSHLNCLTTLPSRVEVVSAKRDTTDHLKSTKKVRKSWGGLEWLYWMRAMNMTFISLVFSSSKNRNIERIFYKIPRLSWMNLLSAHLHHVTASPFPHLHLCIYHHIHTTPDHTRSIICICQVSKVTAAVISH